MKQFSEICVESHLSASGSVFLGWAYALLQSFWWALKGEKCWLKPESCHQQAWKFCLSSCYWPFLCHLVAYQTPRVTCLHLSLSIILGSLVSAPFLMDSLTNSVCGFLVSSPLGIRPHRRAEGTGGFRNNLFRVHSFFMDFLLTVC